jgi:hypothetical protein
MGLLSWHFMRRTCHGEKCCGHQQPNVKESGKYTTTAIHTAGAIHVDLEGVVSANVA